MIVVLVVLAAAVGFGLLRGGRLRAVAAVRLQRPWLVAGAILLQVAVTAAPSAWPRWPLLAATQCAVGAFLWSNRHLPGLPLVAAGWALNTAVVLANTGMPVSAEAIAAAGGAGAPTGRHVPLGTGQHLAPLADVIAVPVLGVVVSAGDLLLTGGAAVMIVRLMVAPAGSTGELPRGARRR